MLRSLYRLILRLYPEALRREHGAEMETMFLHCIRTEQQARPRVLWPLVWLRGLADALGFAVSARRSSSSGPRGSFMRDARWAVRGIRARGWSAVLSVALMAVAMAASTLVFSSADALIFNRVPYPEPERLVDVRRASWQTFAGLRRQTDIFSGVSGHQNAVTFLTDATGPEQVDTVYVTPGLFETLGVLPQWGRPLVDEDRLSINPTFAVVDADIARRYFGSPADAVGQTLATSERTLTIAGVMPPGFRYPNGRVKIWRALDYERINPMFPTISLVARLASSVSATNASAALTTRMPELVPADGSSVEVVPRVFGSSSEQRATTIRVLLGAALCLLLAACANVASLELASGLRRARVFSVQMALGASRLSLVRSVCLEGAFLVGVALAIACGLATLGASVLTSFLPDTITLGGVNPIDVDWRALMFLAAVAAVVWLLVSLPVVVYASRPNLQHVLKSDGRGLSVSRAGSLVRRSIIAAEVALAVMLLVGGLLYVRTYAALLRVETGLDTRGVVNVHVTLPLGATSSDTARQLSERLGQRLASSPGVLSVSRAFVAPPGNGETMRTAVDIDGGASSGEPVLVTAYDVDAAFFRTVGMTPIRGTFFTDTDTASHVVIGETFARHLWGDADPIGRSFRFGGRGFPWSTVVGVVRHVRTHRDDLGGPSPTAFSFFRPLPPPAAPQTGVPAATPAPAPIVNAPTGRLAGGMATLLVRLTDPSRANDLLTLARSVEPGARYTVEPLDAAYASRHAERRMATSIVSGFAAVAFLIAVAGVFGVMTFLVGSRTREIGIRMALGADRQKVSRMVLGSSLRLVLIGVVAGALAAMGASRFIEAQLFGVTPTDPLTFGVVSAVVIVAATLATWHPARRASRVDPAVTLRAE